MSIISGTVRQSTWKYGTGWIMEEVPGVLIDSGYISSLQDKIKKLVEDKIQTEGTYEFKKGQNVLFHHSTIYPRYKFKRMQEELGLKIVRKVEKADVIIMDEELNRYRHIPGIGWRGLFHNTETDIYEYFSAGSYKLVFDRTKTKGAINFIEGLENSTKKPVLISTTVLSNSVEERMGTEPTVETVTMIDSLLSSEDEDSNKLGLELLCNLEINKSHLIVAYFMYKYWNRVLCRYSGLTIFKSFKDQWEKAHNRQYRWTGKFSYNIGCSNKEGVPYHRELEFLQEIFDSIGMAPDSITKYDVEFTKYLLENATVRVPILGRLEFRIREEENAEKEETFSK